MNNNYEWFTIPDFTSYEISVNTGLIRSLKHFKKDCFHIMKVDKKTGKVTMTDDYGVSRREDPTEIYDKTFNQGYPLRPRGTYDVYKGGMVKANRKMIGDVDILGGTTNPTKNKKQQIQTCLPFMVAVVDSEPQKTYTLDFTKVGKIKPFTFENR